MIGFEGGLQCNRAHPTSNSTPGVFKYQCKRAYKTALFTKADLIGFGTPNSKIC